MATHINDAKFTALVALTGVRTDINDMEWRWLFSLVTPYRGTIQDMWKYYLISEGFSGDLTQMQYNYLGSLGYSGDITNRWLQFWLDGGPPDPGPGGNSHIPVGLLLTLTKAA